MNFPYNHRQTYLFTFFAGVRVGDNTAQTGPYAALWRGFAWLLATVFAYASAYKSVLISQVSMLGASVKTSWRLKRRMTMKSQAHERRLEFSGAVAGVQKESWPVDYKNWCAASGQSCQRQTMQEEGAGAQLAHTQLFTVYMNLKSLP